MIQTKKKLKKKIEEFFGNPEEVVKRRLGLIKLIFDKFNPENTHDKLNKTLENIKSDINVLVKIKKLLSIFKEKYIKLNLDKWQNL